MPAEQSIGTLFIADIIPGFFLAAALAVIIIPMARFTPGLVFDLKRHAQHAAERSTARLLTTAEMLAKLVPSAALVALVLGVCIRASSHPLRPVAWALSAPSS